VARQGYRVWLARLAFGVALLLICGGYLGKSIWDSWAGQHRESKSPSVLPKIASDDQPETIPSHALDPVLELARKSLANHVHEHRDYTATLTKRERIGGKLGLETKMEMKLLYRAGVSNSDISAVLSESPRDVSVYLKTIFPKSQAGREVIWVQGSNNNNLFAHEAGLLGIVSVELSPQSRLAMLGNRYPITEIGIEKLLLKLIERGELDRSLGPATVRKTEDAMLGDVKCTLLEVIHEDPVVTVDGKRVEFEFYKAQIFIDEARLVPVRYASYTWPKTQDSEPELQEEYTYENLMFNVGLTDADFDTKNPNYRF
jgi:hypothetical protein